MLGTDERILAELRDLKEQVKRLADAVQKQQDRRSYQKDYYKRRKAGKKAVPKSGLLNRDVHCLDVNRGRDNRLPVAEWAKVLRVFAEKGASSYNFLTWLSWVWNHDTYQHQPITRSGGYYQVFIGHSGRKALRNKYGEKELFGNVKLTKFANKVQLERFIGAPWWMWGYGVLGAVVREVDDEDWWSNLPDRWTKPLRLMQGGYGAYPVKSDLVFDPASLGGPHADLVRATRMYVAARNDLEVGWRACTKGLFAQEEPFTDITGRAKAPSTPPPSVQ